MGENYTQFTPEAIGLGEAEFLLSPSGRAAAEALAEQPLAESSLLAALTRLRRRFSPAQAAALVSLVQTRQRAGAKFPNAAQLFLTAAALEQATAWPVALHRAQQLAEQAPAGYVLDLGCGIGGDTLALAHFRRVIAYERDPVRLRFAQANAQALGLTERIEFRHADWIAVLHANSLPDAAAAFIDPARRANGKRIFSLHDTDPPLVSWLLLAQILPALVVKTMPGIQQNEIPAQCNIEFVSHEGVCKEAVLWFGGLGLARRWASIHTADGWLTWAARSQAAPVGELQAGHYLYEPDPALIRASALAELCQTLTAHLFDSQIAYLVSPRLASPILQAKCAVRCFQIDEIHPFKLKLLKQRVLSRAIGDIELKKRGFPLEPETLRSQLRLTPGGEPAVIFFTRRHNQHLMLIAHRVEQGR